HEEKYRVYFLQEEIAGQKLPAMLEGVPLGVLLIKGGYSAEPNSNKSYQFMESILERLAVNTLIITDHQILISNSSSPVLRRVPFGFSQVIGNIPFGYSDFGPYIYRAGARSA
ncbi:MAG: hypothetical protein ABIE84_04845, partial [bacterium]